MSSIGCQMRTLNRLSGCSKCLVNGCVLSLSDFSCQFICAVLASYACGAVQLPCIPYSMQYGWNKTWAIIVSYCFARYIAYQVCRLSESTDTLAIHFSIKFNLVLPYWIGNYHISGNPSALRRQLSRQNRATR